MVYRLHEASAELLDEWLRAIVKRSMPDDSEFGQLFRIYLSEPEAKKIQDGSYREQMLQASQCTLCAIFNLTLSECDYKAMKNQFACHPAAARHDSGGKVTSIASFVADHEPVDLRLHDYDNIHCEIADIWTMDKYQKMLEALYQCVRHWGPGVNGSGSGARRHKDVRTCCRRTMARSSRQDQVRWPLYSYGQVLPPSRSVPSYLRMRQSWSPVAYHFSFFDMIASSKIRSDQEAIENVGSLRAGLCMKAVSASMALELILNEIALRSLEAIRHGPVQRSCNCKVLPDKEGGSYYGRVKRNKIRGTRLILHLTYTDMPDRGRAGTAKHTALWICRLDTLKRCLASGSVPNNCLYSIGVLRVVKSVASGGMEYIVEPAIEELLTPDCATYEPPGSLDVLFTLQLVDLHEAYFTYTGFLNVSPLERFLRCAHFFMGW